MYMEGWIKRRKIICSVTRLHRNEYYLPNCVSVNVKTTEMELIVNTDHCLLLTHLIDAYCHAWKQPKTLSKATVCSSDRITFLNNSCVDLFISQLFTDETVLLPRNTKLPYSYKLPTVLSDDAPILRFAMALTKAGTNTVIPGAWSKGVNLHSFSLDHQETTRLYLEAHPEAQDSNHKYEIVYLRVENHLLQTTVTFISPLRVLSMLTVPLEIQLHDDKVISSPVTPATTSVNTYLHSVMHPDDRHQSSLLYSPFPFSMVNHFDYYDRDRPENKNHLYIRLRNKTAGIWGNWLRVPDVYYGQNYRLCRIHIPADSENNYNYCYLVNKYNDEEKVNCLELLPAAMLVNETEEDLFFKQYVSEGCVKSVLEENTSQINYNYLLNDGVNNNLFIRPYLRSSAVCSSLPITDSERRRGR